VWRAKDLVGWWSNAHHDRAGGVRSPTPTAWVPGSKPIWFTELGCPAVDKAANQPNVFPDAKSSENARPYFSAGAPDPLAQRQFLRAHFGWWRPDAPGFDAAHNPAATHYDGRMVDADRLYLWTWDARPYPLFPRAADVWADGVNYATGHWLTGRLGALASDELVKAVAADYGLAMPTADAAPPLLFGTDVEGVVSARDALQPLFDATSLSPRAAAAGLVAALPQRRLATTVPADGLVGDDTPLASRKRPDPGGGIDRLALSYVDRERDYLTGTLTAAHLQGSASGGQNSGLVLDLAGARLAAEHMLTEAGDAETLDLVLPPSLSALEPGDVLSIGGQADGPFVITALRDGTSRRASLQAIAPTRNVAVVADRPLPTTGLATPPSLPIVAAAHLPADPAAYGPSRLLLVAIASPWPGSVEVTNDADASALAALTRNGAVGELAAPFGAGPTAVWDDATELELVLYNGHVASLDDGAVLGGGNRLAIETDAGGWEVIGFGGATLVAPATYRLTHLLRGQLGTRQAMGVASAGNRVAVLDTAVAARAVPVDWLGEALSLRAYAGRTDPTGTTLDVAVDTAPALPLAPVHLGASRDPASHDVAFGWVRCSRSDTDSWNVIEAPLDVAPEAYVVTILRGGTAVRAVTVAGPALAYPAAQQLADFGSLPTAFSFTVAQVDPALGPGLVAQGAFHA